jgi:mannitol-1-phosphate/altronate dehydrogenase
MLEVLTAQDGLYTVVARGPRGEDSARVIGVITRYLFAPEERARCWTPSPTSAPAWPP